MNEQPPVPVPIQVPPVFADVPHARPRRRGAWPWPPSFALALVLLTIAPAIWHGQILRRWGIHDELAYHATTIEELPTQLGAWRLVAKGDPVEPHVREQLKLQGYLHRVYEHAETRQRVSLLLMVGTAGPLVRHPPEICYGSQANRLESSTLLEVEQEGHASRFRLLEFSSRSPVPQDFLIAYAFGSEGQWDNPSSPRLAYAGKPMLYKVQVLTDATRERDRLKPAGMKAFLGALVPVLNARFEAGKVPAST
jgi:hypothetical protein